MSTDSKQGVPEEPPLEMLQGVELTDLGEYDMEAGMARFEAATAAAGGGGAKLGLWVALGGVGVVALALVLAAGGDEGPAVATGPVVEAPVRAPASVASPEPSRAPGPEPAVAVPADPREAVDVKDVREPAVTAKKPKRARPPAEAPVDPGEEIRLASEMRRALAGDPARALQLAEEGERQFPGGMFSRERQGHAIRALLALGRTGEARKRARQYLKRYPEGAQSDRIREAVGEVAPD